MATVPMKQKAALKEGFLLKRQRGQHKGQKLRGLRFQTRFVRLTSDVLFYSVHIRDKPKGRFFVKSIAIVEEVPSETFQEVNFGFQIGNQDEVMYFGARNSKERSEWMEAFRLAAVLNNNEMFSCYHSGAFGKDIPNQWSCCRKVEKDAGGCCDSSTIDGAYYTFPINRTQSVSCDDEHIRKMNTSPICDKEPIFSTSMPSSTTSALCDSLNDIPTYVKFGAPLNDGVPQPGQVNAHSQQDQIDAHSVYSADSGYTEKYNSMSSLTSIGNQGTPTYRRSPKVLLAKESIEEIENDNDLLVPDTSSQTLDKTNTLLHYCQYQSSLNALDFKGADTLFAGCKDGKVFMLDIFKSNEGDTGVLYDRYTSEVTSLITWKTFLAISTKNGVEFGDIDNKETIKHSLSSNVIKHLGVSPDGSRIITSDSGGSVVEIWQVDSMEQSKLTPSKVLPLPGKSILLSVSPDPELPIVAVIIVKDSTMVLHFFNYHTLSIHGGKIDIGDYHPSCPVVGLFSPHESKLAIGHSSGLVFIDVDHNQIHSHLIVNKDENVNITCLEYSPIGKELAVGRSDGIVSVLNGRVNEIEIQKTLNYAKQKDTTVSSLSFSKDCSLLAIGHSDGFLNVVRTQLLMDSHLHPSLQSLSTKSVSNTGDILVLPEDDITVVFPEGFIEQTSLTFKYAVQTHEFFGPCSFPPGVRPVSAILSLHPEEDVKFLKPIEITMPHFIDVETEEDCKRLTYFKACLNDDKTVKAKKVLNFEEVCPEKGTVLFTHRHKTQGTRTVFENRLQFLRLYPDHCCCYCVGEFLVEDLNKAMFCLVQAQDISISEPKELTLHYCLPYCLKTCIRNVKNQFPEESYRLTMHMVKFNSDRDGDDPGMGIRILNPDQLNHNGWKWSIQNGNITNKIYRKDVCFWNIPSIKQLNEMCQQKKFPPRFILEIMAPSYSTDSELEIVFPGVVQAFRRAEPKFVVQLKGLCSLPGSIGISRATSGQSLDSKKSPQKSDGPEAQAVKKCTSLISKKVSNPCQFIMELYSNGLLSGDQADERISSEALGKTSTDQDKTILIFKLLIDVRGSILKNPDKFDSLCAVLENLDNSDCSEELKDELKKLRKLSTSGSEKSSSNIIHDRYCENGSSSNSLQYGEECIESDLFPVFGDSGSFSTPLQVNKGLSEPLRPFISPTSINESIAMEITEV